MRSFASRFSQSGAPLDVSVNRRFKKRHEDAIRYRLEFERLISTLSNRFINLLPAEVDNGINAALKAIGEFAGVDRSYVFLIREDRRTMDNTHEWCAKGVSPQISFLQGILFEDELTWFSDKIKRFEIVHVPCVADLPPEASNEKKHFQRQDIQSLIVVPMVFAGSLVGFTGFDCVRKNRTWTEDSITLLKLAGEILANALQRKRSGEIIRESEEKFKLLFESSIDGIIYLSADGIFMDVNHRIEEIFGWKREELIGKKYSEFQNLTEEDLEIIVERLEESHNTKNLPQIMEMEVSRRDGVKVSIDVSARYLLKNGEIKGVSITIRDITERKRAEEALRRSEKRLRQLTDNMTDMVALVSMEMLFQYVSPSVKKILGYAPQDVVGTSIFGYMHPDDLNRVMEDVSTAISNSSPGDSKFRYRHAGGHYIWIEANGDLIYDDNGQQAGAIFAVRDISRQKKAEEDLQKTNRALKESLRNLKDAQHYIVQSEKMASLGSLVAGVAHEINTPVGIGLTASSFLKDITDTLNDHRLSHGLSQVELEKYIEKVLEASTIIFTNLNRAAGLIKSFKLVSVDQSDEALRTFNIKEYIESVLNSLRPKYKETKHTLNITCPGDLVITSYPGCFSQILTNFIVNSLTHGFDGIESGKISLEVSVNNGNLLFKYSDDGRGMSRDTVKKVFEPFFTTNRSHGGAGLGMHIVYNIVSQKLNGHIECISSPNAGASFLITMPLNGGTDKETSARRR